MGDLISCSRCGVVYRGHQCPYKVHRKREKDSKADKFRKSKGWTNKSIEIRQKSKYLCSVCMENEYHTISQLNFNKLSVHHIVPIGENYDLRLENSNLICLCEFHHHLAERGEIPREYLSSLVQRRDTNESD